MWSWIGYAKSQDCGKLADQIGGCTHNFLHIPHVLLQYDPQVRNVHWWGSWPGCADSFVLPVWMKNSNMQNDYMGEDRLWHVHREHSCCLNLLVREVKRVLINLTRPSNCLMGLQHRCAVLLDGEGSEVFDVEQAVAQGCIILTSLFCASNGLLVEVEQAGLCIPESSDGGEGV